MIDPNNITNYHLNHWQLEEHLLFWIAVAGKPAGRTAKALNQLLINLRKMCGELAPANCFGIIRMAARKHPDNIGSCPPNPTWLADAMKAVGIGCYNNKARSFLEAAVSGLDLGRCTAEDLEVISGIGRKTSRCFIMHTRENAEYAGLDTHILHFLRDMGYDTPKSTPSSLRQYQDIESKFIFIGLCGQKTCISTDNCSVSVERA